MPTQIDPNWEDDDGLVLCTTVDGVHYHTTEPRPYSKSYSSHKHGGSAALVYEHTIYTHKNKIASIVGPFPAGTHDKTVFRSKLHGMITKKQEERSNDFRAIADQGYVADDLHSSLSFRNEMDPQEVEWFKDRALSRCKKFNGLTKAYKSMKVKFHHDRGPNPDRLHPRHKACLEAICVTIQVEMDEGVTVLFDPYPE